MDFVFFCLSCSACVFWAGGVAVGGAGVASLAAAGVQGQVPAAVGGAVSSELRGHQGRVLQQVGSRLEFLSDWI